MPRPNQHRSIASEQALARRIAHERETRGMSYEGLASRMSGVGCSIQASAIYKIEKGDPPRRITVDELVGFSQVFGVPLEELLLPPEVVVTKELAGMVTEWHKAKQATLASAQDERAAWTRLAEYVQARPEIREPVEKVIRSWVDTYHVEELQDFHFANYMRKLTNDPEWTAKAVEESKRLDLEEGLD